MKECGRDTFQACFGLVDVTMPKVMWNYAQFGVCRKLETIEIPEGITSIADGMFNECENLSNIKIPDGVKEIGIFAFSDCTGFETIEVPASVTQIDNWAFSGCNKDLCFITPAGSYAEQWALEHGFQVKNK